MRGACPLFFALVHFDWWQTNNNPVKEKQTKLKEKRKRDHLGWLIGHL